MARPRTAPEPDTRPVRLTPSQREHELAMAFATKHARATIPTTEAGTYTTGVLQGQLYLKSHIVVRGETEDWPQFIGRYETELRALVEAMDRLNAPTVEQADAEREADAS